MPDAASNLTAIALIAAVTYGTRISGYLLGTRVSQGSLFERVLRTLPGCALAAVLATTAMRGSPVELVALAVTALVYFWSGRTLLALAVGLSLAMMGAHFPYTT